MKEDEILDDSRDNRNKNPLVLLKIAVLVILAGTFIGASTYAFNGLVSPDYFKILMLWDFDDIWLAAIAQGIYGGLYYGMLFSLVYTIFFAGVTDGKGDWNFAKNIIFRTVPWIYILGIVGGIIGIFFAFTFRQFYDQVIISVNFQHVYGPVNATLPQELFERLGFAWVGGSIWGGAVGGVVAMTYSFIMTKQGWERFKN